jgi:hypothetical protein
MKNPHFSSDRICSDCGIQVQRSGRVWPKRCPPHAEEHRVRQARARAQAWRAANPDRYEASHKRYREANRESAAERSRQWYADNRERAIKATKEYRKKNPLDPKRDRANHLKSKYGITEADFEEMLRRQHGVCANPACVTPDNRGRTLHVDHDHETGRVRGLLCFDCNVVLGKVNDDPMALIGLIQYLISNL